MGKANSDYRQIQETAATFDEYNLAGDLAVVIEKLKQASYQVPKQHRKTAFVTTEIINDYGSHGLSLKVCYNRPETEQEYKRRSDAAKEQQARIEENERKLYEKLQKRYGGDK